MKRIIVTGPTASGKGALAVALARLVGGEIISLDSMKVFRGMDVGTAKPDAALRAEVPFHLLDIVDPWDDFSVGKYVPLALATVRRIEERGRPVIFAGGTGLYLHALRDGFFEGPEADWSLRQALRERAEAQGWDALHRELLGVDPGLAGRVHVNDHKRILRAIEVFELTGKPLSEHWRESRLKLDPGSYELAGIEWPRSALYRRIDLRVERMFERGLVSEARRLLADPRGLSRCARKGIGYRQVIDGLASGASESDLLALIQRDSRRLAKQQMTWFRRFPMTWWRPEAPEILAREIVAALAAPRGDVP